MNSKKFFKVIPIILFTALLSPMSMTPVANASKVDAKKCNALTPFKTVSGFSLVDKKFWGTDCGPGDSREFLYAGKVNKSPTLEKAFNNFRAARAKSFSWSDSWLNRTVTRARLNKNFSETCQLSEGALGGTPTKLNNYVVDTIRGECPYVQLSLIDSEKSIASFVQVYPVEVYFASQYSSRSRLIFYVSVSWEFWE